MLRAVVFDFDGILVDTEPFHHRAFMEVLAPYGIECSWEEYLEGYVGFDDRDALYRFFRQARSEQPAEGLSGLLRAKARAFQQVVRGGVTPYPGAAELVRTLAPGIPLALCSGALRSDVLPILEQLDLLRHFRVLVTADEVPVSKPDPACYSLAVERLDRLFPSAGIRPESCLAIEDTPAGIASARGAGLPVLAVTNSFPAERFRELGCCRVVSSLAPLGIEELRALCPNG